MPGHILGKLFLATEDRANPILTQHCGIAPLPTTLQCTCTSSGLRVRCVSHRAHVKRIGRFHNQYGSIDDAGLNQHRRIGGISRYGDDVLVVHVFDQFAILLRHRSERRAPPARRQSSHSPSAPLALADTSDRWLNRGNELQQDDAQMESQPQSSAAEELLALQILAHVEFETHPFWNLPPTRTSYISLQGQSPPERALRGGIRARHCLAASDARRTRWLLQ